MQNLTAAKFPEASFPPANLFTANFPRTSQVIGKIKQNDLSLSTTYVLFSPF